MRHRNRISITIGLFALVALTVAGIGAATLFRAPAALAWTRGHDTIVLVHGFSGSQSSGSSNGPGCGLTYSGTFNNIVQYLQNAHNINGQSLTWYRQDFRGIKYYSNDSDCGRVGRDAPSGIVLTDGTYCSGMCEDLHNPIYKAHCSGYYPEGTSSANDGTNNESLYHVSCLFAWYLYLNFQHTWNVEIVAHSMGGLIVRNTLYQIWKSKATWTMPPSLPNISDVVTFGTPHGGQAGAGALCSLCKQAGDMDPSGMFITEMRNSAQNPQAGATDWTMMGSYCDEAVDYSSAIYMDGGRKSLFLTTYVGTCYLHGGYLTDQNDTSNAPIIWCDGCSKDTYFSNYNSWNSAPHSLHHMMYALWLSTW